MILGQDVGYEAPNSMGSSDLGQMLEQGCSHAKRMIFVRNDYRDFSSSRVVADDHVVGYTDQPVSSYAPRAHCPCAGSVSLLTSWSSWTGCSVKNR